MLKLLLYIRLTNTSKMWAWFSFYIENSFEANKYHCAHAAANYGSQKKLTKIIITRAIQ